MEHLEGTARDAYFMQRKLEDAFKIKTLEADSRVGYAKWERTRHQRVQSQKESERRVIGLEVLKVKLLNFIEPFSLPVIKN